MAGGGSIKIFHFIQKFYRFVGIFPSQSQQKCFSINWRCVIILFGLALLFVLLVTFTFVEANAMIEYGVGIFIECLAMNSMIVFMISMWQTENILDFIQICEVFVETREHFVIKTE